MIIDKLTKHIFIILIVVITGTGAFAQRLVPQQNYRNNNAGNKQRVKPAYIRKLDNIKINLINKNLNLTSEESERFWPVYNQYQNELTEVLRQKKANGTDSQVNGAEQVDRELYYDQKILSLRKHYRDEFLKILPPEKVSKLYQTEHEFNKELIRQLRERNQSPDDN
jgi:hypothetical protein